MGGAPWGDTARHRVAGAAAPKTSKARSPLRLHPWHACRRKERRRRGDVLAFSALAFTPYSAIRAPRLLDHGLPPNSAPVDQFLLRARRWPLRFAVTLRRESCCLCRLKTINLAGARKGDLAGPRQRQDDWKGLRHVRKRW